ncbi:MAG: hypothetical protein IPQ07_45055 [Myxococcales bacterium]|nr:hypothetical protein [Myxococcales bacterium]
MTPRRYQLKKEAAGVVLRDHPWIFRDTLSSAAVVFRDGDWLRLVDGSNKVLGHGFYEAEGAIAIRVLRRGPERPNAAWVKQKLTAALAKRADLAKRTDGVRLVHGDSDGLPAVVVDRFGDTLVAQSYARGADALTRFSACVLARELSIPNVLWVPAHRRKGTEVAPRVLRGRLRRSARSPRTRWRSRWISRAARSPAPTSTCAGCAGPCAPRRSPAPAC